MMKNLLWAVLVCGLVSGCVSEEEGGGGGGGGGADTFANAGEVADVYSSLTPGDLSDLQNEANAIANSAGDLEFLNSSGQSISVVASRLRTGNALSLAEIRSQLANQNQFNSGEGIPDHPFNFGLFMGGGGSLQVALSVNAGCDTVWDVAHLEMTASCFAGVGTGSTGVAAQASGFAGYAFNFVSGADNWYGRFNSTTISVGLPFDFVSADVGGFSTPINQCVLEGLGGGEETNWDTGIFGVNVGLSVGASVSPSPINFALQSALWQPSAILTDAVVNFVSTGLYAVARPQMIRNEVVLGAGCSSVGGVSQQVRTTTQVARFRSISDFQGAFCKFTAGACLYTPFYWPIWLAND